MDDTCGSCGMEIVICDVCSGKLCEPGCEDREDDGCTCGGLNEDLDIVDEDVLDEEL